MVKVRKSGVTIISEDGHRYSLPWGQLNGKDITTSRDEVVEWTEIESALSEAGITDLSGDIEAQVEAHKESKRQEELDRIAEEQAERKTFLESPEGQAEIRKQQLDEVDREARMIAYETLIQRELESIKPAVDRAKARIEAGEKGAGKLIREELMRR